MFPFLLVAVLAAPPLGADPGARFLGAIRLDAAGLEWLGGFSAIEMDADGAAAVILSDRGRLFPVQLTRDDGRIAAVAVGAGALLTDAEGLRPPARGAMDSEGLARLPDGRLALSFEGDMRVAVHGPDGRETWRAAPPAGSGALPGNGAYEALAADDRGRLYTLAEDPPGDGPVPLYRRATRRWQEIGALPRSGGFRPVGLDFDDRGRLYLLERRFSLLGGFAARLTRFEMVDDRLGPGTLMFETTPGRHGNLEGVSLWRTADGTLVAALVSDDNFSPLLPSEIVEYALPD
nr:esterase-like activity of phytase family protein [Roseibacterium persicicum]